ncbi:hypothetical protein [Nocardioides sp.]|uniref:hypothetical protein n=1 Tax=Nocardioides sp. TaxID=35761 RepID=UPI003518D7AB
MSARLIVLLVFGAAAVIFLVMAVAVVVAVVRACDQRARAMRGAARTPARDPAPGTAWTAGTATPTTRATATPATPAAPAAPAAGGPGAGTSAVATPAVATAEVVAAEMVAEMVAEVAVGTDRAARGWRETDRHGIVSTLGTDAASSRITLGAPR